MGNSKFNIDKKIVAMIPARIGSKRVLSKNLRYLGDKPLICHVLETISRTEVFDEVYVNSDGLIFKEFSDQYGFEFFHRKAELANDTATNDSFAYDFLKSIDCDLLVQILPTSPFLTKSDIEGFTIKIAGDELAGLISVEAKQIACLYRGLPINFEKEKMNPPSQSMEPIYAYATALMGWERRAFIDNYEELGVAYHCPRGKTGLFALEGPATIDIDNESDFLLAEKLLAGVNAVGPSQPRYFTSNAGS